MVNGDGASTCAFRVSPAGSLMSIEVHKLGTGGLADSAIVLCDRDVM